MYRLFSRSLKDFVLIERLRVRSNESEYTLLPSKKYYWKVLELNNTPSLLFDMVKTLYPGITEDKSCIYTDTLWNTFLCGNLMDWQIIRRLITELTHIPYNLTRILRLARSECDITIDDHLYDSVVKWIAFIIFSQQLCIDSLFEELISKREERHETVITDIMINLFSLCVCASMHGNVIDKFVSGELIFEEEAFSVMISYNTLIKLCSYAETISATNGKMLGSCIKYSRVYYPSMIKYTSYDLAANGAVSVHFHCLRTPSKEKPWYYDGLNSEVKLWYDGGQNFSSREMVIASLYVTLSKYFREDTVITQEIVNDMLNIVKLYPPHTDINLVSLLRDVKGKKLDAMILCS